MKLDQEKSVLYIKRAALEDYRSIQSLKINFLPGLNIIIGKNGSGKSNAIRFLYPLVNGLIDNELLYAKGSIVLSGKNEHTIKLVRSDDFNIVAEEPRAMYVQEGSRKNNLEGEGTQLIDGWLDSIEKIEKEENAVINSRFIGYGLPGVLGLWTLPMNTDVTLKKNGQINLFERGRLLAFGLREFYGNRFLAAFRTCFHFTQETISINEFESLLKERFSLLAQRLSEFLAHYSPVSSVRLSPDALFLGSGESKEFQIRNLHFEFFSEGNWRSFGQLSDGTKRVVYLISELIDYRLFNTVNREMSEIVFLEEPELGIHPHQLNKLMDFLKEQSEEKQIIITTHSPQVLDVLGPDELDRVIICEYDKEKGTQLRHMSEEEMEKAKSYMQKMYLSDFWRYTDFNDK